MEIYEIPNIPELLDAETAKRIKLYPHPNNRASEAGHPCVRFLVLARTQNNLRALHDVGLQRIFDEGNLHEDALMREVQNAGFRIVEQQRPYEWPKFQLTGRIDGKLAINGIYVPFEIKSCSPNVFPSLRNMAPEDMINSKYPWIRKYPAQILLYMLMEGVDMGVMLFKNKTTGEKLQKVFHLEGPMLEYVESILKKLEAVNDCIDGGMLPPAAQIEDCRGCGFAKTACFPGQDYGPGFDFISDVEIEAKLERRGEILESSKEFEELDKEIKEHFKGKTAICGSWMIESKAYETTSYDVPKELKAQYAVKKESFRTKIERI